MQLPKGSTVAVADGKKLNLNRNTGDEAHPALQALPAEKAESDSKSSGSRRNSSSANPDHGQLEEDSFAAGTAELLNRHVLGTISDLVIVAAPKTLGELRKHYHKTLSAVLVGEISKDLTGHSLKDIEKVIAAA
jgi:protein required for attachment to host cells